MQWITSGLIGALVSLPSKATVGHAILTLGIRFLHILDNPNPHSKVQPLLLCSSPKAFLLIRIPCDSDGLCKGKGSLVPVQLQNPLTRRQTHSRHVHGSQLFYEQLAGMLSGDNSSVSFSLGKCSAYCSMS